MTAPTRVGTRATYPARVARLVLWGVVLVARLPWLDRRIGMDRLTSWHRWTGFALFWAVLLHVSLILVGYSRYDRVPILREVTGFAGIFQTLVGMIAAGIIVIAVVLSVRLARRRLSYEAWHAVHVCLYVAIALALIHQLYESSTFKANPLTWAYWWVLWTLALVALVIGRVVLPLRRNARHQLRVARVVPESDNVVSVYVTGRGPIPEARRAAPHRSPSARGRQR